MLKPARPSRTRRAEGFVFADPSGRRWRSLRVLIAVLSAGLLVLSLVAVASGLVSPWSRNGATAAELVSRGNVTTSVAVGSGPVQRVLAVKRSPGEVSGVDPGTDAVVHRFTAEEIRTIGDAQYVDYFSGYDTLPAKTVSLTFDDGPDPRYTPELLDVLGTQHVPATFFVIGKNVARNPQIVQRMVAEGHAIGDHTMNHPDLAGIPAWRNAYELVSTDRIIRATTGIATRLWRLPYDTGEGADAGPSTDSLLAAQQRGYLHAGYDFDTTDWALDPQATTAAKDIPLPDFSSDDHLTVLLHDAGGPHREKTVAYVRDYLIPAARAHGYTFTTLPASSSAFANGNVHVTPSWADEATLVVTKTLYVWPTFVMHDLFLFTVALTAAIGLLNIGLAFLRSRAERRWRAEDVAPTRTIPVTVLLAAYNEEKLIERTIRTVLASRYPISEVVVVDDGSTDATSAVVTRLMAQDARIRLLQQPNAGKSAALNHGLTTTQGEVVITIDADTIVGAQTVSHLMRRYERDAEGRIGVVAGAVRVGNYRSNVLTRWQALEYVTQIGIDRAAQAVLDAIAIVPGACTAWRRDAILEAGGFKDDNLAEDADLALSLHRLGWRVDQAGEAYAFTEAPDTMDDLLKQRVRWTYGIMQAMWKHRSLLFSRRHPGLGFFVYPMYILNQLIPLVFLPIIVVVTVLSLENGGWPKIVEFFAAFVVYQFLVSFLAITFLGEDRGLLRIVPLYRVIYEPLRAYLLYATVVSALKGIQMRWNRVHRTGSVDPHLGAAAQRHGTVAPVGLTPGAERPGAPAPGGPR